MIERKYIMTYDIDIRTLYKLLHIIYHAYYLIMKTKTNNK